MGSLPLPPPSPLPPLTPQLLAPPPPPPPLPLLLLLLLLLLQLQLRTAAAQPLSLTCDAASTFVGRYYDLPEAPSSVAVDVGSAGTLIVADARARAVLRYDLVTRAATPWLGLPGSQGLADGVGTNARFDSIADIVQHGVTGDVYIGSSANGCVRRATPTGIVTSIGQCANAGSADGPGGGGSGGPGGPGTSGSGGLLCGPAALAIDSANGVLYVQQLSTNDCGGLLRAVDLATFEVTTLGALAPGGCVSAIAYSSARESVIAVAGCGSVANKLVEFSIAANTTREINSTFDFGFLGGVALSSDQSAAYVSDAGRNAVLKVDLNTNTVAIFAGGAATCPVITSPVCGGQGAEAKLVNPSLIHASPLSDGPIFVTTPSLPFIYSITLGARVEVLEPTSTTIGGLASVGAGRLTTRFSAVASVAFDGSDNLLVVDSGAHAVLAVSPSGDVTVVAGELNVAGVPPYPGPALAPHFFMPTHLAVNLSSGVVFIADRGNNRIQVFDPGAGTVAPYAGTGDAGTGVADGGALTEAQFYLLCGVAVVGDSVFALDEYSATAVWRLRRVRGGRVDTFPAPTGCGACVADMFISSLSVGRLPPGGGPAGSSALAALYLVGSPLLGNASAGYIALLPDGPRGSPNSAYVTLTDLAGVAMIARQSYMDALAPRLGTTPLCVFVRFTNRYYACPPSGPCAPFLEAQGAAVGGAVPLALDGVMGQFDDAVVNTAFLAADSTGALVVMDRGNGKVMRVGVLSGAACDEAASRNGTGICRAGSYINFTAQTCEPCWQPTNYTVALPYATYCNGEKPAPAPKPAVSSPTAALPTAVIVALGVLGGLAALATAGLLYCRQDARRKRRAAEAAAAAAAKALQSPDSAVNVLVAAINSSRGSLSAGLSADAVAALAASAGGGAGGGGGVSVVPNPFSSASASASVSTLRFSDLKPEPHVAPLYGGFGVVFCATWVSRGIRVAIKVPRDLVLSGFLAPAAAAELVKEAQGLVHASDGSVNEFVVRLFAIAQGDGGAAWSKACERARSLYFAKNDGGAGISNVGSGGGGGNGGSIVADSTADGAESPAISRSPAAAAAAAAAQPAFNLLGLVMAWESGGTLADALLPPPAAMRAPWPSNTGDRLRIAREIAVGLFHLHRVGIVHGDLKLENVLLSSDSDRHVRLADFGLADLRSRAKDAISTASRLSTAIATDHKRGTWCVEARDAETRRGEARMRRASKLILPAALDLPRPPPLTPAGPTWRPRCSWRRMARARSPPRAPPTYSRSARCFTRLSRAVSPGANSCAVRLLWRTRPRRASRVCAPARRLTCRACLPTCRRPWPRCCATASRLSARRGRAWAACAPCLNRRTTSLSAASSTSFSRMPGARATPASPSQTRSTSLSRNTACASGSTRTR